MHFDLDQRTASLGVGEFSDFTLGPRDATGASSGLWRAQLGTHWHNQLRAQAITENPAAQFEIPITGQIVHHGWTLTLTGRIDQLIPPETPVFPAETPVPLATKTSVPSAETSLPAPFLTLREIKTVTRPIPAAESELRAEYPAYFVQLATYAALRRQAALPPVDAAPRPAPPPQIRAELHFVEIATGLSQTITLSPSDDALVHTQLERVTEFLNLRHRARERLRNLHYRPPFTTLRPGQETTGRDLAAALAAHPIILFEAPTGFGKTGVLLELALSHMRAGRFDRLVYLTSKATGQLQVTRTLAGMTADSPCHTPVTTWLMRPKREHCINTTHNCSRDACAHLQNLETRWPKSGLSRFYLLENHPRDIATLRAAGAAARICPYEITRAALPFNDVWIGDCNYIFSPAHRGIFTAQPGYDPARTLLIVDEAHNLPPRVADAFSHAFHAHAATAVTTWFRSIRVPSALHAAWTHWEHFLATLKYTASHPLATEDDARDLINTLARQIAATPLDYTTMPPDVSETLWAVPEFAASLSAFETLPRLWWSPQNALLVITCLDAAQAIGPTLHEFNAAILASATLTPTDTFAAACGLDEEEIPNSKSQTPNSKFQTSNSKSQTPNPISQIPDSKSEIPDFESRVPYLKSQISNLKSLPFLSPRLGDLTKRDTKKLFQKLTSAAALLALDETRAAAAPHYLRATTPWRDDAYDVAIDTRVNTTYQQRAHHAATTAATIATLAAAVPAGNVVVFFPSYAYAETIRLELAGLQPPPCVAMQPRLSELAAQNAWLTQTLSMPGVILLVLGSSFAEGIDLLGGRISHAMVVGPALPEVNPIQHARLAASAHLGREEAARRVYQIPGIQKVNQALGRLVRAPGHRAKVLLHCRRFAGKSYHDLLAPEYRATRHIATEADLADWLK
jgi:Rad3-related DNA helicase